jgi:hypothetical protein
MKKWLAGAKSGNLGESSTALESVTRERIESVSKHFFTKIWGLGEGSRPRGAPSNEYKKRVEARDALVKAFLEQYDTAKALLVLLNWLRRPILRGGTRRAVTQRASASLCTKCTRFDIIAVLYTCTTVASRVATNACATHLRFLTEPQTSFGLASSRSPGVVKT